MFIAEAVTISNIEDCKRFPLVKCIRFKDRLYKVVTASLRNYSVGDEVIYISDGAILPEWLLKKLNLWDYKLNKGFLFGALGNTVKPYYYGRDKSLFSFGMILPYMNGEIYTPNGSVSVRRDHIEEDLELKHITKRLAYFLLGDLFLEDIKVQQDALPEIEVVGNDFINQPVIVQERIPGKKFFVTVSSNKLNSHAIGDYKNVYICAEGFGKYRYLSDTKKNLSGNLFVKLFYELKLGPALNGMVQRDGLSRQYTFSFVLGTPAYVTNNTNQTGLKQYLYLVDIYTNEPPFGSFLPIERVNTIAKGLGLQYAKTLYETVFDYTELSQYLRDDKARGFVIRTTDNVHAAIMYSPTERIKYVQYNA